MRQGGITDLQELRRRWAVLSCSRSRLERLIPACRRDRSQTWGRTAWFFAALSHLASMGDLKPPKIAKPCAEGCEMIRSELRSDSQLCLNRFSPESESPAAGKRRPPLRVLHYQQLLCSDENGSMCDAYWCSARRKTACCQYEQTPSGLRVRDLIPARFGSVGDCGMSRVDGRG